MSETATRQEYNRLADFYDQRWHSYITKTLSTLRDWAQSPPGASVLDIGCGTGELELLLLRENPQQVIQGVDISENMLLVAQQKCHAYPHVSFHHVSVSQLPFENHSFDVIVSASVFHYFDDPIAALTEIRRVLKPQGQLFILDWCKDYLSCQICDVILKLIDPAYKQCYSQRQFHSFLLSAQFAIERAAKFHFHIIWGMMIVEARLKT